MFYKYDECTMQFLRVRWIHLLKSKLTLTAVIISLIVSIIVAVIIVNIDKKIVERQIMVIVAKQNQFQNEKLIKKIREMNFQFPYIVYAQSLLETDSFRSRVFIENQNLFGMKPSVYRITSSMEKQGDYKYYSHWMDSLYDYALYSATYLSKLTTEDDYFDYLKQSYAEDANYVSKLKSLIQRNNLKSKFE